MRSSWTPTWPLPPGARADGGGIAGRSARVVEGEVSVQDPPGHRRESHAGPRSRFTSCSPLTGSAALSALAGRAALTGAGHAGNRERGRAEGAGSGTRRVRAPDRRDAGRWAKLRLGQTTGATRHTRHHLREAPRPAKRVGAPRPAKRVAGNVSSWP